MVFPTEKRFRHNNSNCCLAKGVCRVVKNYFQPQDLEEALKLLKRYGRRAKILAGGTDLMPSLKRGEVEAEYIISLNSLPGLDTLEYDQQQGLRIGPRVTYAQL